MIMSTQVHICMYTHTWVPVGKCTIESAKKGSILKIREDAREEKLKKNNLYLFLSIAT